jgi:hypothetical protein
MNKEELYSDKAVFCFRFDTQEIRGADISDQCNMPSCYSITKRYNKRAWEALKAAWHSNMTMYGAMHILEQHKARMHSYYACD